MRLLKVVACPFSCSFPFNHMRLGFKNHISPHEIGGGTWPNLRLIFFDLWQHGKKLSQEKIGAFGNEFTQAASLVMVDLTFRTEVV